MKTQFERILATTDVPRRFLSTGIERSSAVGRIVIYDQAGKIVGMATGFLISKNHVLTCHHVIPDVVTAHQSTIEFDFFESDDGVLSKKSVSRFSPEGGFLTDEALDITIVKLEKPETARAPISILRTKDAEKRLVGEFLNGIHFSGGEPQSFSLRDEVLDVTDSHLHYSGTSGRGSSGAPLFDDKWAIVGVHHSGVPARDKKGRMLASDGSLWKEGDDESQIHWIAKEAIRITSISKRLEMLGFTNLEEVDAANVHSLGQSDQPAKSEGFVPKLPIRDSVFISYAHGDQDQQNWKDRLVQQLTPIPSIGATRVWDDSRIDPGSNWLQEIEYALKSTRVAILLVGPHFLNSEFVRTKELPPLLTAARDAGVKIFPLITDYAPYTLSSLGQYQAFNDPESPLESLPRPEQNRILLSLAKKVAAVFGS